MISMGVVVVALHVDQGDGTGADMVTDELLHKTELGGAGELTEGWAVTEATCAT